MNDKKATELSMNVIIIAAIALVVLVVIVMLVMNSTENVVEANKCSSLNGGECISAGDSCNSLGEGYTRYYKDCEYEGDICCALVPGN